MSTRVHTPMAATLAVFLTLASVGTLTFGCTSGDRQPAEVEPSEPDLADMRANDAELIEYHRLMGLHQQAVERLSNDRRWAIPEQRAPLTAALRYEIEQALHYETLARSIEQGPRAVAMLASADCP